MYQQIIELSVSNLFPPLKSKACQILKKIIIQIIFSYLMMGKSAQNIFGTLKFWIQVDNI